MTVSSIFISKLCLLQNYGSPAKRINVLDVLSLFIFIFSVTGPVNGSWGAWSDFYPCSVTCGGGNQTRVRECSNPAPVNEGDDCPNLLDDSVDIEPCNIQSCDSKIF